MFLVVWWVDCFGIEQVQDVLQLEEVVAQVPVVEEEEVVVGEYQAAAVVVVVDLAVGNLDEKVKMMMLHPCYQQRYVVPKDMSLSVTVIHKSWRVFLTYVGNAVAVLVASLSGIICPKHQVANEKDKDKAK